MTIGQINREINEALQRALEGNGSFAEVIKLARRREAFLMRKDAKQEGGE